MPSRTGKLGLACGRGGRGHGHSPDHAGESPTLVPLMKRRASDSRNSLLPSREKGQGKRGTVMTFIIRGISTVMTVTHATERS